MRREQAGAEKARIKQIKRFLKLLAKRTKQGFEYFRQKERIAIEHQGRVHTFNPDDIRLVLAKTYVEECNARYTITPAGLNYLMSEATSGSDLSSKTPSVTQKRAKNTASENFNTDESPLLRLFSRKTKNGKPYISADQFHAGERLRQDFERGQLQPSITSRLSERVSGSKSANYSGSSFELSDFSIDARARVSAAVEALGPELGGVALDICCFLKGLEQVERERQWPPRSAKLMLRTALSHLCSHYGMTTTPSRANRGISHWGDEGYRPEIGI